MRVARTTSDETRPEPGGSRPERGAAAVEFALIGTVLFLVVFGIIDFGFAYNRWSGASNASREAARLAAVKPDTAAITARAKAAASNLDQSRVTVTVTCSTGGGAFTSCPATASNWKAGDYVRVSVDYRYTFVSPLGIMLKRGDDMTLHTVSEVRFEGA